MVFHMQSIRTPASAATNNQHLTQLTFTLPTPNFTYPWLGRYWACSNPRDLSTCTGLVKDMLDFLAGSLNMTINIFVPDSYLLGRKLANGTWIGGVKHVSLYIYVSLAGMCNSWCSLSIFDVTHFKPIVLSSAVQFTFGWSWKHS